MNVLILNGGSGNGRSGACRKLKEAALAEAQSRGWEASAFDLDGMNIKPCRGCFACWVKHPGQCAIQDDEVNILKAAARTDVRLLLTPITFGGYNSSLKRAMDRSIPNLLPFFIKVRGEVHHPQRYDRRNRILAVGTLPHPDPEAERIFRQLVDRNALNMASLKTETRIFYEDGGETTARQVIRDIFAAAGAAS